MGLSVVVIACNEVDRIGRCLASVPFADEVLVFDSGSTDGTDLLAADLGATVVRTDWPGHVAQKNRAMAAATQSLVLSLDADEWLSDAAAAEVVAVLDDPADVAGWSFPRLSHWLGRPMRHGRWYPDRKVRLVRPERATWMGDDPHDHLAVHGPVLPLDGDILHTPYRSFSDHLNTIDRYSRIHARTLAERGVRAHWWDPAVRPPLHFVNAVLLKRGFLDGPAGLAVAGLGSAHVWLKWRRLRALQ